MRLKIIILLIVFYSTATAQYDISFKENFIDSTEVKLDSILLIGAGSSPTRIFLDNMSKRIINSFTKAKIHSQYEYLGKNSLEAKSNYEKSPYKNYKAILLLLSDSSSFEVHNHVTLGIGVTNAATLYPYPTRNKYLLNDQTFNCQLFIKKEKMTLIWNGVLHVSCNPSDQGDAAKASAKIISSLKSKKLIK